MSTTFRPYVPDQSLLLPPDVREWLPEGHLAHHVSDLVDGLDLTAFYALYEGDGRRNAPYEPRMMVKVLLYAYATGVFSSRRVARKLEEDVGFRVLAAGNFPQHRTLCEFRRRHLEDFQALFVEVVRLAQELGLARLGKLSIDGTKVRANASKRKAMSYDRMQAEEQRLESEVEALLRQADAVAVKETFAAQPETVLADAGYCNERDLTDLEERGIDGYVALGREGKQTATRDLKAHPAWRPQTMPNTLSLTVVDTSETPVPALPVEVAVLSPSGQYAAVPVVGVGVVLGNPRTVTTDAQGQADITLLALPVPYRVRMRGHDDISFRMPNEDVDLPAAVEATET